jgi:hypothetical protein
MMFRFAIRGVLWLMVVVATVHAMHLRAQQTIKPASISVASFGLDNVIGYLGQPLGTLVRVTGVAVSGESTRRKADVGKILLQIEAADGRRLSQPITFEFQRAANGIAKPAPGQRFDYRVHEWGVFDGVVQVPGVPAIANDGFFYHRQITIHKDNGAGR